MEARKEKRAEPGRLQKGLRGSGWEVPAKAGALELPLRSHPGICIRPLARGGTALFETAPSVHWLLSPQKLQESLVSSSALGGGGVLLRDRAHSARGEPLLKGASGH